MKRERISQKIERPLMSQLRVFSQEGKGWLMPLFSILISALILFFLLIPAGREIFVLIRKEKSLRKEKNEFLSKVQLLSSLDEEELRRQGELALLALPERKDVSLILFSLVQPARKNGFYVNQFEFNLGELEKESEEESVGGKNKGERKKEGLVKPISVEVSLEGDKENLLSLFRDWERSLPLVELENLNFQFQEEKVNLDLTVKLYYSLGKASYQPEKIKTRDLTLSPQEKKLLEELASFHSLGATFSEEEYRSPSKGRENPFSW